MSIFPISRNVVCVALALCAVATWGALVSEPQARAQNFDAYRPDLPRAEPRPERLPLEPPKVEGDDRVLVGELKALVFVDTPEAIRVPLKVVDGIHVDAAAELQLLRTPGFDRVVRPYLGEPVTLRRLNEMVRDIILFYRANDQPVVDVSIPEQDITEGVVQVVVTEGRAGKVIVRGGHFFNDCMLARQVQCVWPDGRIYESSLLSDLRWLNRSPYRTVDLELRPGDERGETDVIFNVEDWRPVQVYAGYDDASTRPLGIERNFYGISWGNAFGLDHTAAYQYTTSTDYRSLRAHSAIYMIPTLSRDYFTFMGSYADLHSEIDPSTLDGVAWQTSLRYNQVLCDDGIYQQQVIYGFDFKQTNTNLEFGGETVSETNADIIQFLLGYTAGWNDGWGAFLWGIEGVYGPSGLTPGNTTAAYRTIRFGADADYFYGRAYAQKKFPTAWNFYFLGRITGQVASCNLLPSEQLGFGGFDTIRGYDMRLVNGDSGYILNGEIWSDPWCSPFGYGGEWQTLAFIDHGTAYDHNLAPGQPPSISLTGIGCGLRYNLTNRFALRADYGWQLQEVYYQPEPRSRWHVGAVLSY